MISAERRRSCVERNGIGRDRNGVFMTARRGSRDIRRNFRHIDHILTADTAQRNNSRIARFIGNHHHFHRVLRDVEVELNFFLKSACGRCRPKADLPANQGKKPEHAI